MARVSLALTAALLLVAAGCGTPGADAPAPDANEPGPVPTGQQPVTSTAQSVATSVTDPTDSLGVLGVLDGLLVPTLASLWARSNPDLAGSLEPYLPAGEVPVLGSGGSWCVRALHVDTLSSETTVERRYYFYMLGRPQRPDDFRLAPVERDLSDHYGLCRLGMVVSEIRTSLDAAGVGDGLRALYEGRFGAGATVQVADLPGRLGSVLSREATTWVRGDLTVGLARSFFGGNPVAFAYLPIHATGFLIERSFEGTRTWELEVLALALDAGEVDATQREMIERLLAQHREDAGSADEASVLSVLRYLTERPTSGDPDVAELERYAARLTAADLLLAVVGSSLARGSTAEDAFRALGALYQYSEFSYSTDYMRSLADSAALASGVEGGWGDLARISTLEEGCNSEAVIETGLELRNRVREPRFLARLNFLLGEAHASLVSIDQEGELRPGIIDDIDVIRQRAVTYYAAAIAGDLDPDEKERAWLHAWGIGTGFYVPPRYDCAVP